MALSILQKHAARAGAPAQPVAATTVVAAKPAPAPTPLVKSPKPAKPTPPPEPVVEVEVEEVEVEPTRALSTNFSPSVLALLSDEGSSMDALNAIMERPEGGKESFDGPFPLLKLQGGQWTYGENVEASMRAFLPVAAQPTTGVFLAYRLRGTAWPTAYDEGQSAGALPLWDITVNSTDAAEVLLAIDAAEAVQYTKKPERSKFDGIGHLTLGMEVLMFREETLFVLRIPQVVSGAVRTLKSLTAVMQGVGGLRATPVIVSPQTTEEGKEKKFETHSLSFAGAMTGQGAAVWKAYQALRPQLLQDEEFLAQFNEWNTSTISDEAREALTTLASMRKAR